MASESPIAQLAAKPLKQQVAIYAAIGLLGGLLYYQFAFSSLNEDLDSAKSQVKREQTNHKRLKQREKDWEDLKNEKAALEKDLSTNQVSLPATASLPSFIGQMQRQAAVAGVTFKNWKREEEEAVTSFVKVPISIEVVGSFHQILKYFHLLSETKRIITVENFSIKPAPSSDEGEGLLLAEFKATTFRQPDSAGTATNADSLEPEPKPEGEAPKNQAEKMRQEVEDVNKAHEDKIDGVINKAEGGAKPSALERLKNSEGGSQ